MKMKKYGALALVVLAVMIFVWGDPFYWFERSGMTLEVGGQKYEMKLEDAFRSDGQVMARFVSKATVPGTDRPLYEFLMQMPQILPKGVWNTDSNPAEIRLTLAGKTEVLNDHYQARTSEDARTLGWYELNLNRNASHNGYEGYIRAYVADANRPSRQVFMSGSFYFYVNWFGRR